MNATLANRVHELEQLATMARSLPAPHGVRLAHAIRAHLDDGLSIDSQIGLTPSERTTLARDRRDMHLRRASEHLDAGSAWARARALCNAAQRFLDRDGRHWREAPRAPDVQPWGELWQAYRAHPLPSEARMYHRILTATDTAAHSDVSDSA